jgi:hypothetical protein
MSSLKDTLKQRTLVQKLLELQLEIHGPDGNIDMMMDSVKANLPPMYLKHSNRLHDELGDDGKSTHRSYSNEELAHILHGLNICLFSRGPASEIDVHVYYDNLFAKLGGVLTDGQTEALDRLRQWVLGMASDISFDDNLFVSARHTYVIYLAPDTVSSRLLTTYFHVGNGQDDLGELTLKAVNMFKIAMGRKSQ